MAALSLINAPSIKAMKSNILFKKEWKNSADTARVHRRAWKDSCMFISQTASYQITQSLQWKGNIAISLLPRAKPHSHETCLLFSRAIITYVVFCFLFPRKVGNLKRGRGTCNEICFFVVVFQAHLGLRGHLRALRGREDFKHDGMMQASLTNAPV